MSINIPMINDYSYLFSGLGSSSRSSSLGNLNFLSDYASIKNGSYAKLMKAYYSKDAGDEVKKLGSNSISSLTKEENKKLAKVQTATDALKESADALLATGKDSLFEMKDITTKDENGIETTTRGYDKGAIYKALEGFVKNYNSVIDAVDNSGNDAVSDRAVSLAGATIANLGSLNKIGITVNEDMKLDLDQKTFEGADMSTVKALFNGVGSYGYRASAQASLIDYAAQRASTAGTYNQSGTFTNGYNNGSLFNSIF